MGKIPKWLDELFIAHRGFFNEEAPENSIAAFKLAIERGYAIEFDVQLLKDDTLIVFHDKNLKRTTGLDKDITEVNYTDIMNLKLLNSNEKIPTLQEVLDLVNGQVPLMIEFKNQTSKTKLEELSYNLLKDYKGEYIVQSFNPLSLLWFKRNASEIVRGQLSCRYENSNFSRFGKFLLRNVVFNFITKPDYIIYDIKGLDSLIIKWLKLNKRPLYGYTSKSIESYKNSLEHGVRTCFEGFDPNDIN